MHILILGAYCSCNLGDAVICRCVEQQLRQAYPDAKITIRDVIARDRLAPKSIPKETMLRRRTLFASARRRLARLGVDWIELREERRVEENRAHLEEICSGDYTLAVFAGGQLFMDGYALFLEACVQRLKKRGIPVIFNACGTGPLFSPAIAARLDATLRQENVVAVSTRDDGASVPAVHVSDPALDTANLLGIHAGASDTVGLGVMYPAGVSFRRVLRLWRQIIARLERRGEKWQLFTNGDPADELFANKILSHFPGREDRLAPRNVTPEGLVRTVAGYKGIISYRLHSHVIAVSLGIPTAALVWDQKLRAFFGACGCPERCFEVTAKAEDVLNALEAAKDYDRPRIQRQVLESRRWLLDAVEKGGAL